MEGRFSYVQYDEEHTLDQEMFKDLVSRLECGIENYGPSRPASLALTKLEETYMWIGKMIRDDQATKIGTTHVPERTNS